MFLVLISKVLMGSNDVTYDLCYFMYKQKKNTIGFCVAQYFSVRKNIPPLYSHPFYYNIM